MAGLPDDLPVVERSVVRMAVLDAASQVLLLHTRDSTDAGLGTCWELPGGGLGPDETYLAAAIRELWEETGISVSAADIGEPRWRRDATYRYRGYRWLQHEQVVTVQLASREPRVDTSHRDVFERSDSVAYRWWPVGEIAVSRARFYPGRLPTLLPQFLEGCFIEEPFETWS